MIRRLHYAYTFARIEYRIVKARWREDQPGCALCSQFGAHTLFVREASTTATRDVEAAANLVGAQASGRTHAQTKLAAKEQLDRAVTAGRTALDTGVR